MRSLIVVAMALASTMAFADTAQIRADEKACLDKAQSNAEMKDCAMTAYNASNLLLESTKGDIYKYLTTDKGDNIKEIADRYTKSQAAWSAYKEADCHLEGVAMLGGSGEGLIVTGCHVEQTLKRVDQLIELQKVW